MPSFFSYCKKLLHRVLALPPSLGKSLQKKESGFKFLQRITCAGAEKIVGKKRTARRAVLFLFIGSFQQIINGNII